MSKHATSVALLTALALCVVWVSTSTSADRSYELDAPSCGSVVCVGDCNTNGIVTVDEVVALVSIVLGDEPISACPSLSEAPDIGQIILAVNNLLVGCPPVPTPTPITYRLLEGSTIVYSPPSPKEDRTVEEPLSGTFVLGRHFFELQFSVFEVTRLDFLSFTFVIVPETPGHAGFVRVPIGDPIWSMEVKVLINGQPVDLQGYTTFDCCSVTPPSLQGLELCGSPFLPAVSCENVRTGTDVGYSITLFAHPMGGPAP